MLGYVDAIDGGLAKGWIVDEREGRRGLTIEIWLDGRKVAVGVADRRREDLFKFGLDGSAAGFAIPFARDQHDDVGGAVRLIEPESRFLLPPGLLLFDPPKATAPLDIRRLEPRLARRLAAAASLAEIEAQITALSRLTALGVARSRALRTRLVGAGDGLVFDRPETPQASIVVAASNGDASLQACLRALAEHPQRTQFEIVVVHDGAHDATRMATSGIVWLTAPREVRNAGAAVARGNYLVFLDPDTRATPEWLDALIETFCDPSIAVVGARLIDGEGRVRACGGGFNVEGAAIHLAAGADLHHPSARLRRDCDFVSDAALAIRKSLFASLGGFDAAFASGPYADADLCARVWAQSARVVVQPAASVVCSARALTGAAPGEGYTPAQLLAQAEFRRRRPQTAPAPSPRALFIDDWTPRPDRDAGSNVALQHMLSLQRLSYHVIFAASQTLEDAPIYTDVLERAGIECVYSPFYASLEEALERLAPFALIYLHRFSNARAYLDLCRRHAPILYNVADLHGLRQQRARDLGLQEDGAVDAEQELGLVAAADAALVHSTHELQLIRVQAPQANAHLVVWPFAATPNPAPFAARRDIGFLGSFGHPPNVDAIRHYARDILPAFASAPPLLHMAGSGMGDELRALEGPHIHAVGHVEDIDGFLGGLRATVAPLRFGAGVKGKVLASLACGTPCVMTSIAAEGLELPPVLQALVADDPREIAARLAAVAEDAALWLQLSEAGLAFVAERFTTQRVDAALAAAIASAQARATDRATL